MKRNNELDEDLAIESEKFYQALLQVTENHIPELCEIVITFSMKRLMEKKNYSDTAEITQEDYVLATQQATAWMEYILGHQRH